MPKVQQQKLYFTRGDDRSLPIAVTKTVVTDDVSSSIPVDITGWTFFFTAKKKPDDLDSDAVISVTVTSHSDPTNGVTAIPFSHAATAIPPRGYPYDIQYVDNLGNVTTFLKGVLLIQDDVTKRIS